MHQNAVFPEDWYKEQIALSAAHSANLKRGVNVLSWLRLGAVLVVAIVLAIVGWWGWTIWPYLLGAAAFLLLVKFHATLQENYRNELAYLHLLEAELAVGGGPLAGTYSPEEDLERTEDHPFALDLDLYGQGQVLHWLNRAGSPQGRSFLRNRVLTSMQSAEHILAWQEAYRELAGEAQWRLRWLSGSAREASEAAENPAQLLGWIKRWGTARMHIGKVWIFAGPAYGLGLAILATGGWIGVQTLMIAYLLPLVITGLFRKQYHEEFRYLSDASSDLRYMIRTARTLEEQQWMHPFLRQLAAGHEQGQAVSGALKELSRIVAAIDQRNNVVVALALNALLLWDIQQWYRLSEWKNRFAAHLPQWNADMVEMEAHAALAQVVFNHPHWAFPEPDLQAGTFFLNEAAHPLLPADTAVRNSMQLAYGRSMAIITGANMAGKSTWLRTVGVNWILAHLGLPVCAKSMHFGPAPIYTSMRTTDALSTGKSYFFSELDRLARIARGVEVGSGALVLLDEILKGTNSEDQTAGSLAFLQKLLQLPCTVLVATHDLKLCALESQHPNNVSNHRFEIAFEGEELIMDYRLQSGICQSRNALLLLKKMGLTAK